jgi:carbamate kinase
MSVAARALAPVSREHQLIIPHGNRPQVRLPALQAHAYTPDATCKRGGIEAKIDKDLVSEPPARKFDADLFVMVTDVTQEGRHLPPRFPWKGKKASARGGWWCRFP